MARAWRKKESTDHSWQAQLPGAIAALGPVRLGAAVLALAGFGMLSALTKAGVSFPFEMGLILWLQETVTGLWGWLLSLAYYAGDTESAGVVTAIVLIYLLLKRWWQESLWFAVATAGALILVGEVFKPFFDKSRPPFVNDPSIHGAAFPSGHGTGNTILYLFIAYLLSYRWPQWSGRIHLTVVAWLLLMGFGSMRVGAHWASDIVGGYCLGFLWLMVCLSLLHLSPYLPGLRRLPRGVPTKLR